MSTQQTDFHAGSTVQLICSSNSIKSTSNQWQWYHNSQRIPPSNDRYIIANLTREEMGMYQCCYITGTSDSNACCAQTQVRAISKFCFSSLNDSLDKQKIFIITYTFLSH